MLADEPTDLLSEYIVNLPSLYLMYPFLYVKLLLYGYPHKRNSLYSVVILTFGIITVGQNCSIVFVPSVVVACSAHNIIAVFPVHSGKNFRSDWRRKREKISFV